MKSMQSGCARKECPMVNEFEKDIEKERRCQGMDRLSALTYDPSVHIFGGIEK